VRLADTRAGCNAELGAAQMRRVAGLSAGAQELLASSYSAGGLSARGHARAIRVARTIADLTGADRIAREHMLEALALRQDLGTGPLAAAA
jgi:magnesium chelatase family protein